MDLKVPKRKTMVRTKTNNITLTATFFTVAVLLLCAMLIAPVQSTASAEVDIPYDESLDWEQIYNDYIGETDKEWYLGEDYLDFYNAFDTVQKMLADKSFNKEALKADPIVIASIDNGISVAYGNNKNYNNKYTRVGLTHIYIDKSPADYKLHSIFDGVLLTDENGNYVYENFASTITYRCIEEGSQEKIDKYYQVEKTGDIAHDMVTFNRHGVSTAGVMAYFIHKFGLEDYIKIMPIKVSNKYDTTSGSLTEGYSNAAVAQALQFAYDNGADIVNVSFGAPYDEGSSSYPSFYNFSKEMLIVAAAGNDNSYYKQQPAALTDILGVVNYVKDAEGNLTLFQNATLATDGSNYGEWYEIAAPGQDAIGAEYTMDPDAPYGFSQMGGTSMASPIVAFAGALAMFRFRGYDNYGTTIDLTTKAYKEMIPYCVGDDFKKVEKVAVIDGKETTYSYPILNFQRVVSYDFLGDDKFLNEKIGVDFYISSDADAEVYPGEIVSYTAHVTEESLANFTPQWTTYVNNVVYQTGTGWDFEITIPRIAGDYTVQCVLVDNNGNTQTDSKSFEFRVKEWGRDWETIYNDFTEDLIDDWYFDEEYIDLYNAIEEVKKLISSSAFDREALKNDPIVIASIETGIGAAYATSGQYAGRRCGIQQVFIDKLDMEYRLHPIFEDVLLTDENGDYVYYISTANQDKSQKTFIYEDKQGVTHTFEWFQTGNIAQDLVSFDDHGIGVTGIIAYLIHQFGLEDYIKILPIKADDAYYRVNGMLQLYYTPDSLEDALDWAIENGADIVNASFGMPKDSGYETQANEILIVGAAGNTNTEIDRYPSSNDNVLGVMNYVRDENGNLVLFTDPNDPNNGSTYGEWYDIATPGETLVVPCYGSCADYSTSYKTMGGTSASAPVASFASAIAMLRYSGQKDHLAEIALTPEIIREMIPYCTDQTATRVRNDGTVFECKALDLKELVTYDFYGDVEFLKLIGVDVDNMLVASSNAQEINMAGDVVTLNGTTNPRRLFAQNELYWWYEHDGITYTIGYGWNIDFELPKKAGEYKVYCALLDEDGGTIAQCVEPAIFEVCLKPEKLNLSAEINSNYKVDTTAKATATASINKDEYTSDTPYWWIVRDGKYTSELGTGWDIEFNIPSVVGDYEVFCALKDAKGDIYAQSEGIEFAVTYYDVESISINGNVADEYKIDNTASVTLTAVVNPSNAHIDGTFVWTVERNGQVVSTLNGQTITLDIPNEVGTYKVYCTYGSIQSTNSIDFAVTYYDVESISINGNIADEYKIDNTANITLTAVVNPNNAHIDGAFVWTVERNGQVVDTINGQNIALDIPSEVGTYKVYCTYGSIQSTNYIEFAVTYYDVEEYDIVIGCDPTETTIGEKVAFAVDGLDNVDPQVTESIEWYVNDILVATGTEYSFIIGEGEYNVRVVVNGESKEVATYNISTQGSLVDPEPTPNPTPDPTPDTESTPEQPAVKDDRKTLEAVIAVLSVVSVVGIATSICLGVAGRKKSKKEQSKH